MVCFFDTHGIRKRSVKARKIKAFGVVLAYIVRYPSGEYKVVSVPAGSRFLG